MHAAEGKTGADRIGTFGQDEQDGQDENEGRFGQCLLRLPLKSSCRRAFV